ncbi:MAG: phenylalanine 4-monooxygenase [Bacteroidota bacterium]
MDNSELETEDAPVSAYEAAAAEGVDPRCIPQRLESEAPIGDAIPYPDYSAEDHAVWGDLYRRQMAMMPGRACAASMRGFEVLNLTPDRLPPLSELSRRLEAATGWRVARIPGLLHERDFFTLLANRTFPSTDYIRGRHEIDYTPAPDCFHDMFGHMPMLTQPDVADFYQQFGQAALQAEGSDRLRLERFHWFTIEFGLIQEDGEQRFFGAGIQSSKNEIEHALSDKVTVLPFDAERIVEQDYDVWHLQNVLFELRDFSQLVEGFTAWAGSRNLLG